MADGTAGRSFKSVGISAWRAAVLVAFTLIVLVLFGGMTVLVFRGEISEGPLVLFTGLILGYVLRTVQEIL